MELRMKCRFGERRKKGKVVRGPTCTNIASGIFEIAFRRGANQIMPLCADCAFVKMPNRVRMIVSDGDEPVKFFRDVVGVSLVHSLNTKFVQEQSTNVAGAKHWVEPKHPVDTVIGMVPVKKIKSTGPAGRRPMDMAQYINSLRRHDDGK